MLISVAIATLLLALDLDSTGASAFAYDRASGVLTVYDVSGVQIASGTELSDVYSQLH